jgi:hypothetical protein
VPDPALVAAHVRRLDPDARAAVVADCVTAAGVAAERDGTTVRVRRAGRERRLSTVPDPEADRVLSPAAVRDVLLYRVARPDGDRIAERHLGAPLDDLRPPLSRRVAARAGALATPVVLLVLVVAAAGVVVGGLAGGPDEAPATPAATTAEATVAMPRTSSAASEASRVPGLGVGGVRDVEALAAAHDRARPESYVARVRARRIASDYDVVTRNVTLRVAGDRYRADVVAERAGERTNRAVVYGDGDARWAGTRRDGGWTVERLGAHETGLAGVDPTTLGPTGVRNALATPETDVSGPVEYAGWPAYRVVGTGVPASVTDAVETYRVVAHVRPDGFVYAVRIEYTLLGPRLSDRSLEWRYVRSGATVEMPLWHPEAGDD